MNGEGGIDLQRLRFEFERDLEERKLALEERKLEQAQRESWSRIIGTVLIGGLLSAAIAGFGIYSEWRQDERARQDRVAERERAEARQTAAATQAREDRRGEMLIQLVNAREGAVTDLRARMFDSLLRNYLEQESGIARITVLKMLGLNFRDAIYIKPLFEMLEQEMEQKHPSKGLTPLEALRKAASSIVRDQVEQIRLARDGAVCAVPLEEGERKPADCMPDLQIELIEVEEGRVRVRTNSSEGRLDPEIMAGKGAEFSVSFFDMPMIDYTSVLIGPNDTWRYSIVLNSASPEDHEAELTVAVLPTDSYDTHRAYGFDELLADFLYVDRKLPLLAQPNQEAASPAEPASTPAEPELPVGSWSQAKDDPVQRRR